MTTIASLTLRQLAGAKRIWLVLVIAAMPILAGVAYRASDHDRDANEFADHITSDVLAGVVLPLVTLLLATAALGSERSDRTLGYLVLKPIARWRIAAPKVAAAALVGGIPVATCGAATVYLVTSDAGGAVATAVGLLAGSAAYAALFAWAGLATRHALVMGLVYVFVWEASLAAYLDGIRYLSIRGYALAVIGGLDDARLDTLEPRLGFAAGALGIALAVVAFGALTVRTLQRMDVP